jgi:hypothetical protein
MNDRHRIVWLNVLQLTMVLVGFGIFLGVKSCYQQRVIISSFKEALKDDIMGKQKLSASSSRIWLPWLALPPALVLGRNAASIFFRAGRKKRQIKRDIKAALLLGRLQEGHRENFSLYLRSFTREENLKRRKGVLWYVMLEGDIFGIDRETLDLMLSSQVRGSYPMITLGRPGERLGAGRLPSDDAGWKALAFLLMKHAKVVFIVPDTSEGVIWEMKQLKGFYEKAVYIMPPTKYYQGAAESAEKHWDETRREFEGRNIFLPEYSRDGALFMLDGQGRIAEDIPFDVRYGVSGVHSLIRQIP